MTAEIYRGKNTHKLNPNEEVIIISGGKSFTLIGLEVGEGFKMRDGHKFEPKPRFTQVTVPTKLVVDGVIFQAS